MTATINPEDPATHTAQAGHTIGRSTVEPLGLGHSLAVGAVVGMVLALVGVTLGLMATGLSWVDSIGVGIFAAFWGGIGFGTMIGGVIFLSNLEDH